MQQIEIVAGARFETDGFDAEGFELRKVSGREAISQPFELVVDLVAREGAALEPEDMIGGRGALVFTAEDGSELRRVHGYVCEVTLLADDETLRRPVYRLRLVPRAWLLGMVITQEVFMDMTVPEIIAVKLQRAGLGDAFEMRLLDPAAYPKRELCVQYRESDLQFVSRLAEHAGMSFFFEHTKDGDRIVFSDHNAAFHRLDAAVAWRPGGEQVGVHALSTVARVAPRVHAVNDYNYRTPNADISAVHARDRGVGGVVEYGSHHKNVDEGAALARVRAEETESARRQHLGGGVVVAFGAGLRVRLEGHPRHDGRELLLTAVEHELAQALGGEAGGVDALRYENRFTAVPIATTYRPPRVAPRPRIHGVVTGIVQPGPGGAVGGHARLDEQGRYTVQLCFDTAERGEEKASHPIRMAQPFAGPNQGMHFPLRPGTEVMLVFVDGDPDRPIIAGAVPNPVTQSPSNDKAHNRNRIKTASGIEIEFSDGR